MTVGHSLWPDQLTDTERAKLEPGLPAELDREPDVLIVGGGILGCATAAACVRAALGSVVLLERERFGAGASGGAAGLIMPEAHVGVDPPELVDLARLSLESWCDLEATWPGGVGLLLDYLGQPQARVNPLRAIARLVSGLPCVASGVAVLGISTWDRRIRALHTTQGEFRPRTVVFATGMPPRIEGLPLDVPAAEVKGHMVVSESTPLRLPARVLEGLARQVEDGRVLMGGTLDIGDDERVLRPEVTASMWRELSAVWPDANSIAIQYRWACFRPAHPDHLPVIDRLPGLANAWLTSGHYKTGILMAPATGRALAQWLASGSPPPEVLPFTLARLLGV
jgi:glycine/D-amino acid oxidase-like deaminating enzyme